MKSRDNVTAFLLYNSDMKKFFTRIKDNDSYFRAGVGVIIINSKHECVLFERSDIPGSFQSSQGGLDRDEDPQAGALRELYEETGILESSIALLGEYPEWLSYTIPMDRTLHKGVHYLQRRGYRGQTQKWFYLQVNDDITIDLTQAQDKEFSSYKWIPITDVVDEIIDFKRPLYKLLMEYLEKELL